MAGGRLSGNPYNKKTFTLPFIHPQKAAACGWLFAPLQGRVTLQADILCPGIYNLPEQRKNGSGDSPPAPCKNSKKWQKPLFRSDQSRRKTRRDGKALIVFCRGRSNSSRRPPPGLRLPGCPGRRLRCSRKIPPGKWRPPDRPSKRRTAESCWPHSAQNQG